MNEISLNYWGEITHYHRPITWYTKKLKESGFTIEEIKENPDNIDSFYQSNLIKSAYYYLYVFHV